MCVFGRCIFHMGFLWADEVNQMLLVAVGMFGSARTLCSNGHAEFTSFMYFYMFIPMGFGLCIYEYLKTFKKKILTAPCPKHDEKLTKNEVMKITLDGIIPLGMPIIIVGGIMGGVCTPTEAGAVAVVYSLLVSLFISRT